MLLTRHTPQSPLDPLPRSHKGLLPIVLASSLIVLGACSSSNDSEPTDPIDNPDGGDMIIGPPNGSVQNFAFVASRSSDYSSGRVDRYNLDDGVTLDASYTATLSDIRVDTDGESLYQIGRFGLNTVTRLDILDTASNAYEFSVSGDEIDDATGNGGQCEPL